MDSFWIHMNELKSCSTNTWMTLFCFKTIEYARWVATAFVNRVGITGSEPPCYGNRPNYLLSLLFTSSSYCEIGLLKGIFCFLSGVIHIPLLKQCLEVKALKNRFKFNLHSIYDLSPIKLNSNIKNITSLNLLISFILNKNHHLLHFFILSKNILFLSVYLFLRHAVSVNTPLPSEQQDCVKKHRR